MVRLRLSLRCEEQGQGGEEDKNGAEYAGHPEPGGSSGLSRFQRWFFVVGPYAIPFPTVFGLWAVDRIE